MRVLFVSRDVILFTLYSFAGSLVFETPIFVVFLTQKGLPYSQISWILSLYALAVILFEYVTGVWADRYTRKLTLIASTASLVAGELCFILGKSLPCFAGGIVLIALSTASRSGADTALIYDKLVELGRKDDFDALLSSLGSLALLLSIGATLAGPALTRWSMATPFWATLIFSLLSMAALAGLREPAGGQRPESARFIVAKSLRVAVENKKVLGYIAVSVLMFPCYHILYWLLQPYLQGSHVPVEYFGVVYALITLFQSLGTRMTAWLTRRHAPGRVLAAACGVIFAGFALLAAPGDWPLYAIPAVMGLAFGVYYTVNSIVVNQSIESDVRASLLSLQHALTKVTQVILFGLVGLFINDVPLRSTFACLSIFLVLAVGALFLAFRNHLQPTAALSR